MDQNVTPPTDAETLIGHTKEYVDRLILENKTLKEALRRIKDVANEVVSIEITKEELLILKLNEPIETLDLETRAYNCLISEKISLIGDLVKWSERDLLKTPNLGMTSIRSIQNKLAIKSLHLGYDIGNWVTPKSKE